MELIKHEQAHLRDKIAENTGKNVLYHLERVQWKPWPLRWRWTHEVRYPEAKRDVPILRCDWTVTKGKIINVTGDGTADICITFQSEWFGECEGEVKFWIKSEDHPSTKRQIEDWKAQIEALGGVGDVWSAYFEIMAEMSVCDEDKRHETLERVVRLLWHSEEMESAPPVVKEFITGLKSRREFEASRTQVNVIQDDEMQALKIKACEWAARPTV
jgi:hypothetical protein